MSLEKKNTMKKIMTLIGIIVGAFLVVVIAVPILNSLFSMRFKTQVAQQPRMHDTLLLQEYGDCGVLKEGNSFAYISATALYIPNQTLDSVKEHYSVVIHDIKDPKGVTTGFCDYEVIKLDSYTFETSFADEPITLHSLAGRESFDDCYVIVIYDDGYSSPFDYRTYF